MGYSKSSERAHGQAGYHNTSATKPLRCISYDIGLRNGKTLENCKFTFKSFTQEYLLENYIAWERTSVADREHPTM